MKNNWKEQLFTLYSRIPSIPCTQCHQCCGPILWFYPEELCIQEYLQQRNIQYLQWTTKEFHDHDMKCPYLQQNHCVIYPIRPLICRLQGVISALPCPYQPSYLLPEEQWAQLKLDFEHFLKENNCFGMIFGTKKYVDDEILFV